MYATRDAAIKLAQEDQLSEANWEPSAKSAIPFTINHSIWQSNAAVNTPVKQQSKHYMSLGKRPVSLKWETWPDSGRCWLEAIFA